MIVFWLKKSTLFKDYLFLHKNRSWGKLEKSNCYYLVILVIKVCIVHGLY